MKFEPGVRCDGVIGDVWIDGDDEYFTPITETDK